MNDHTELAARFAEISLDLSRTLDEPVTFDRVARRAVEVVPGVDHAAITLRARRGSTRTVGSTHEVVTKADELQLELGEGPCLDAALDRDDFSVIPDMSAEARWPRWAPAAFELGLRSMVAVRLSTGAETLGALNLYSSRVRAFDRDAIDIALIYSSHAAEAMDKARLITGLQAALEGRHVIGIAQGLLMARYDVSAETAFEILRRYSNDTNTKLRDLSATVVAARDLPADVGLPLTPAVAAGEGDLSDSAAP